MTKEEPAFILQAGIRGFNLRRFENHPAKH